MNRSALKQLSTLRKQGKTRFSAYHIEEDDSGEEAPNQAMKRQLEEEDFVVDDDGQGYLDDSDDSRPQKAPTSKPNPHGVPSLFKKQKKVVNTPVRKQDNLADDLISGLRARSDARSDARGSARPVRAPMTPVTPTPVGRSIRAVRPTRPVMRPLKAVESVGGTGTGTELNNADMPAPSEVVAAAADANMSDDDVPLEAPAPLEPAPAASSDDDDLPSDPPVPSTPYPKSHETSSDVYSLPTPNQSSDFDYEQNVVEFSSDQTPKTEVLEPSETIEFFYNDYSEAPDSIMLFGRSKSTTVCVIVEDLYRDVYFLPKQGFSAVQVKEEVAKKLFNKHKNIRWKSRAATKKYCFGIPGVPKEAEYLQVVVPFSVSKKELQELQSGSAETYSHVFGIDATIFERFSLINKVKGPGWLRASSVNILGRVTSSCAVTASVKYQNIDVIPEPEAMPNLTLMSLSLRTWFNPVTKTQEIIAISARFFKDVPHDTLVPASKLPSKIITGVRPFNKLFPPGFKTKLAEQTAKNNSIMKHDQEVSLLNWFMTQMRRFDPDVIIGHNLENIQFGILFQRLRALNINTWHFMGRRGANSRMPASVDHYSLNEWTAGRLYCDLSNDMAKSVTPECDTWSLSELCKLYLNYPNRPDIEVDVTKTPWDVQDATDLLKILRQNEHDTLLVAELALKVQILALSKTLTNIAGNSWAKTLSGSRVDRNEYILLHEFTSQNYIVPDRFRQDKEKHRFEGGRVFEPEKGLCRNMILVMDFNSLYPSIIQEFNICFTTVDTTPRTEGQGLPPLPAPSTELGIFPKLIQDLVRRRRETKAKMKRSNVSDSDKRRFDVQQQALKLTANSMYGCLGYDKSRFYAVSLAELTTTKGREILEGTRELAERSALRVVYGDTDSVMIDTNAKDYKSAMNIGAEFKKTVNSQYKVLEIDIDNVFSSILLNNKKKYAAMEITEGANGHLKPTLQVKGMDLKRREFCELSKEASRQVLDLIFDSADIDAAITGVQEYLGKLGKQVQNNEIPVHKYVIRNRLNKEPKAYAKGDADKHAHVNLALRRMAKGEIVRAGDVMSFVMVTGEGKQAENARLLADVVGEKLPVDTNYYLEHQLLPPLWRICENIDGFNAELMAEQLGIDPKKAKSMNKSSSSNNNSNGGMSREYTAFEASMPAKERFKDCARLELECPNHHKFTFLGPQSLSGNGVDCPECKGVLSDFAVYLQVQNQVARQIRNYYDGETECNECGLRTRQLNVRGRGCTNREGRCPGKVHYVYSSKQLFAQLSYYLSLFDASQELEDRNQKISVELNTEMMRNVGDMIKGYLENNARRVVDMGSLFGILGVL